MGCFVRRERGEFFAEYRERRGLAFVLGNTESDIETRVSFNGFFYGCQFLAKAVAFRIQVVIDVLCQMPGGDMRGVVKGIERWLWLFIGKNCGRICGWRRRDDLGMIVVYFGVHVGGFPESD